MQIDILELSKLIGACSVILGVILGGYKLYDKLLDRIDALERRVAELEKAKRDINEENALVIYALRACLDGLHQQGCNGKVTDAMERIDKHINKAAHE